VIRHARGDHGGLGAGRLPRAGRCRRVGLGGFGAPPAPRPSLLGWASTGERGARLASTSTPLSPGDRAGYILLVLSSVETTLLRAFKAELAGRFHERLARVTLFGSRARGEGRDDSDLDVLVAIRGVTRDERREVLDLAADLEMAHELVLSPLVTDADAQRLSAALAQEIARDGVPL
jgi:uncharacterized protein